LHRFFVSNNDITSDRIEITGNDYQHISRSLRLQEGDNIIVCTGDGNDLLVQLDEFNDNSVVGRIVKKKRSSTEPQSEITIAQAIPKSRNMELVVQKTTEIGIKEIIPLHTKRTIVKLKGKKKKKRINRWQRIAEEAAKQSQRGIIPPIKDIHTIKQLKNLNEVYDLVLTLWADEEAKCLKKLMRGLDRSKINKVLIIIGPEGGFTDKEICLIKDELKGHSVSLGPRIFRTETAGLVGLSALLYELDDLGG
jgi:16S rRNA (uracil1498-N3)-methyltransferase